ncbi:hypothetical protein WMY93_004269 [Mugilogobius chulae]|uniref:Uncharacterized protein n=1 Tax=Mugilogobius chulae TaxID=88201 RepID=A0AAW0PZD0_9GOBI
MEDVVLHYKSGPDQDLSALIRTTEKLLAPFSCRPPQVFSPWFPSVVDRHLPLRPARSPPRILSAPDLRAEEERERTGLTQEPKQSLIQDLNQTVKPTNPRTEEDREKTGPSQEPTQSLNQGPSQDLNQDLNQTVNSTKNAELEVKSALCESSEAEEGILFVPETPPNPPDPADPGPGLQNQTRAGSNLDSPSKRCWSMFRHRLQSKDQTRVQTSSQRFLQTVSKLQPLQRVKWVIDENNCRDMEQVWRSLSRPSSLPSSLPSPVTLT